MSRKVAQVISRDIVDTCTQTRIQIFALKRNKTLDRTKTEMRDFFGCLRKLKDRALVGGDIRWCTAVLTGRPNGPRSPLCPGSPRIPFTPCKPGSPYKKTNKGNRWTWPSLCTCNRTLFLKISSPNILQTSASLCFCVYIFAFSSAYLIFNVALYLSTLVNTCNCNLCDQ